MKIKLRNHNANPQQHRARACRAARSSSNTHNCLLCFSRPLTLKKLSRVPLPYKERLSRRKSHSKTRNNHRLFFRSPLPRSVFIASLFGVRSLPRDEAKAKHRSRACCKTLLISRRIIKPGHMISIHLQNGHWQRAFSVNNCESALRTLS